MSFSVHSPNRNDRVMSDISNLNRATYQGIRWGFHDLGHTLFTVARDRIKNPPKTGRLYPRPDPTTGRVRVGSTRRYRASRKGEAPANPTGNLRSSVGFQIEGVSNMEFGYRTEGKFRNAAYGEFLELMMDRPNLAVAVDQTNATAHTYFERAIERALTPR